MELLDERQIEITAGQKDTASLRIAVVRDRVRGEVKIPVR